ncbi:MAG: thiosulfate oxidation carrier protein SoxY [Campylobacterota bacterium]|nr:thiosulfate oxidation carrier protein SoxY [Campylobacterota bacterium]
MERRSFFKNILVAGGTLALMPSFTFAADKPRRGKFAMSMSDAQKAITSGKKAVSSQKVKLSVPNIAENGKVVPVKVLVDHPMEEGNYISSINVLTSKNGNSRCARVFLNPINGEAYFSTRIKLGGTQDVVVIAETNKGEYLMAAKPVKVTIGGCG